MIPSGSMVRTSRRQVVALRLPPATFVNRFAVFSSATNSLRFAMPVRRYLLGSWPNILNTLPTTPDAMRRCNGLSHGFLCGVDVALARFQSLSTGNSPMYQIHYSNLWTLTLANSTSSAASDRLGRVVTGTQNRIDDYRTRASHDADRRMTDSLT